MTPRDGISRLGAAWRALYPNGIPLSDFDVAALMALVALGPAPSTVTPLVATPTTTPTTTPPSLVGTNAVATRLGLTRGAVSWLVRHGRLQVASRRGRHLLFHPQAVEQEATRRGLPPTK